MFQHSPSKAALYEAIVQGGCEGEPELEWLGSQGRPYLSVSLDDPSFAAPLNAALAAGDRDDGSFVLAWT